MRRLLLPCLLFAFAACPPPAPSASLDYFRATPDTVAPGNSAQLGWSATGVTTCQLTPGVGEVPATGTVLVTPEKDTTYTLECGALLARTSVTVAAAVAITEFTATPQQVAQDGFARLSWTTVGADACALTPDQGPVASSGTVDVQVTQAVTYALTCTGYRGPAKASVTITLATPVTLSPPTNLALAPKDNALTLTWTQASGATDVYLATSPGITKAGLDAMDGGVLLRKVKSPFTVGGLQNGTPYYARVAAVSGALQSDLSDEATGTPVAQPDAGDPYYAAQWHLHNTGQGGGTVGEDLNVEPAWGAGSRGAGVRVAVVDEGVDLFHADLVQNTLPWASHDYLGTAALSLAQHGTCVAGLVAARDGNGVGLRGVAPRANLVSYNVLQKLTSANEYDSMTRGKDLNGASNNSWGDAPDGTGLVTGPDPLWLKGVEEGTRTGRGGLGTVYLWASGNGGSPFDQPTVDRSDYDGQANSRFVFSIGGVGYDGTHATYAEAGANVLVATPTEGDTGLALTTTDITGRLGYNDGRGSDMADLDYTSTMNGTSGATPEAAGVVALILEANPRLTWRDVRRVLAYSARKNAPGDSDWAVNGAGLHINHRFGFGVPDAAAAVLQARNFVPGAVEVHFTPPASTPALAIPDHSATGASDTVNVSGSGVGHVEFVEVTVTIPHARTGDLRIELVHAGGATSVFHDPHQCAIDRATRQEVCSDLDGYTFGSVRHLDEPGDGAWTLKVTDSEAGNVGTLQSWTLALHGRP